VALFVEVHLQLSNLKIKNINLVRVFFIYILRRKIDEPNASCIYFLITLITCNFRTLHEVMALSQTSYFSVSTSILRVELKI